MISLGCEGKVADVDAGGVGDGGAERRRCAQKGAFADALGAVGSRPVLVLDHQSMHCQRQVLGGGDAVVEGAEVADAAVLVEQDVFHQGVAESHDRSALILGFDL